jgi:hypothetical protein
VAIGQSASSNNNTTQSIAIGFNAGFSNSLSVENTIAIGVNAGNSNQGSNAIALGTNAGVTAQKAESIAIGRLAGNATQGLGAIALGALAGQSNQGTGAVAIGSNAGICQASGAVAIGTGAGQLMGQNGAGVNSIAIGNLAANTATAFNNYIVLNATGGNIVPTANNTFTVAPVRNTPPSSAGILEYNANGEITYNAGNTVANLIAAGGGITSIVPGNYINVVANPNRSSTVGLKVGIAGNNNSVLTSDSAGNLSWQRIYASSSGGGVDGVYAVYPISAGYQFDVYRTLSRGFGFIHATVGGYDGAYGLAIYVNNIWSQYFYNNDILIPYTAVYNQTIILRAMDGGGVIRADLAFGIYNWAHWYSEDITTSVGFY